MSNVLLEDKFLFMLSDTVGHCELGTSVLMQHCKYCSEPNGFSHPCGFSREKIPYVSAKDHLMTS